MANPLKSTSLDIAAHVKPGIWRKGNQLGVLSRLAPQDPEYKVGETNIFTFTGVPKAELVGEGADKSNTNPDYSTVKAKTYKVQVTYRFTDELMYQDEDYQIGVVEDLAQNAVIAISRSLDLIAIHGVNPLTGTVSGQVSDYLDKASYASTVEADTSKANYGTEAIEASASQLVTNGYVASAIALDPVFANSLSKERDGKNNKLYPELGLGFNVQEFQGLPAAVSDTVSGRHELAADKQVDLGIMGDFNAFSWGIARNMPLTRIEYGDPDGKGDLKRNNQIALRAETYIGFVFMDPKAFVVIKKKAAAASANTGK